VLRIPDRFAWRQAATLAAVSALLILDCGLFPADRLLRLVPLRFNTSASLPVGLYRVVDTPLRPGAFVSACPPVALTRIALARQYAPPGSCPGGVTPLAKRILALPGTTLVFGSGGFRLNGHLLPATAPLPRDSAGRPLLHQPFGIHQVNPGEVWLYASARRSWDSRYWGAIPLSAIRDRLAPLWIFP